MHLLKVGKPYIDGRKGWPETVEYNFRRGEHELRMFLRSPSNEEVEAVARAECEFALVYEAPVIIVLSRFGLAIPWREAPFSWYLVPESERVLPDPKTNRTPMQLLVILVEASSGIVLATRALRLTVEFTSALHAAIRSQAAAGWPGHAAYDRALASIHRQCPHGTDLLRHALARCHGGE